MPTTRRRVLVVADRTAQSPELMAAVTERAAAGPCVFTLLVPARAHGLHRLIDPEDQGTGEAEIRLSAALGPLSDAAGGLITGMVGSHEPLAAIQDALNLTGFDEVIISTLPVRISRWLHLDLPRKVRALGVPVTEVTGQESEVQAPAPAA